MSDTTPAAPTRRLRAAQYLGYAGGDAANNLTFTLVSMFLLVYYTDVAGITAAAAGTILLVSRIWAAFTDVFAGQVVDRTTTRWGRFRPYFVFAGVPLMALAAATFRVPAGQSEVVTLIYAYATYMLFNLCYSFVNIPFGSLASAMTQRADERARLSAARSIGAAAAIIGLTIVVSPQINRADDLQRSLNITTLSFAVLGVALYLVLFRTAREYVARDTAPVSLKQSLRGIRQNRPLLLLCLSALSMLTGLFIMQTLQVYYARDVLGNADYTIILTILTTGAMFVVSPLIPKIVETFGKQRAYVAAGAVTAIGGLGIAFSSPAVLALPLISFAVYGIGMAAVQSLMWALQADTVEYGDWISGLRIEGANYATLSFTRKAGQGIGGALAAFGIGFGGYLAGAATQSPGARDTIRYLTGLGPAVFVGIGAAIMLIYPLSEERFRDIVAELTNRRREQALQQIAGSDGPKQQ